LTLRQTAGRQGSPGTVQLGWAFPPRSARVYCLVVTNMLLQTPAAQELLARR
jgi:hypothetical protein